MRKSFYIFNIALLFSLIIFLIMLSTIGIETNKFNDLISNKIKENNRFVSLKLDKIKFKLDIKKFNLFLITNDPEIIYKDLKIPIKEFKAYLDFFSLVQSKTRINKIEVSTTEINIKELKKIIIKTKPSTLNSFVSNNVENGNFILNLEMYFNEVLKLENFIARGQVKNVKGLIKDKVYFKDVSFNFFADSSDILVNKLDGKLDGLSLKKGNIRIKSHEDYIDIQSSFDSEIIINNQNINSYLTVFGIEKNNEDKISINANLNNLLNIKFDKTFKVKDYSYKTKGKLNNLNYKFFPISTNNFLKSNIDRLFLKKTNLEIEYSSNNSDSILAKGEYSLNNKDYQTFDIKNTFTKKYYEVDLNFSFIENINFELLNYKKDHGILADIKLVYSKKRNKFNFKQIEYSENKSIISIKNAILQKNKLTSLGNITVKTFVDNVINNDFSINYGDKIKISGAKFDAKNLNNLIGRKSKKNIFSKVNKNIEINLKNISTSLSKELYNFKLIGNLSKGKFVKISAKGEFGDNKFLDISMRSDTKNKKKYLEIYSDIPQPLLANYSFFKGLTEGILHYSSIIEENNSSSKLKIENFKIINAPGLVKLLSLADLGGLADLAEGEGLSFSKMEIKMNDINGFLKLNELYADGSSISVLMEGYKEKSGLTSLKGTLVPAKNLNKLLSKIPVIGKVIIPEQVGEGLFGVSFKIKGTPGKMKTTINPIKTLTPRFITKALEKTKNAK